LEIHTHGECVSEFCTFKQFESINEVSKLSCGFSAPEILSFVDELLYREIVSEFQRFRSSVTNSETRKFSRPESVCENNRFKDRFGCAETIILV
jgi:hypothetical protein